MSTQYPPAEGFTRTRIADLSATVVYGVALTAANSTVVAPSLEEAMRYARRTYGDHIKEDGAQEVVMLKPERFKELLQRAGLTEEAWEPA